MCYMARSTLCLDAENFIGVAGRIAYTDDVVRVHCLIVIYFAGHRRSISSMICSAQRIASPMALIVAGTLAPPSYCASFRAARILAAMSSTRFRPSSIQVV
jgi:hypothetical protein